MKYFPKVSGDRIYLSPLCPDDAELYTRWMNNPRMTDLLGNSAQLISLEKEKTLLADMAQQGYHFAIVGRNGDRLLGNISFFDLDQTHRHAQCGLFIGDEAERNKGYGAEALRLLLSYGFNVLNLNSVMLRVFAFNENAIACYQKVGFKKMGERRQACYLNGQYHNEVYMDILAEEFRRQNPPV